tara:strand:+ start:106 stop:438 length:333 start_codon:yes stop_codon:yes gene_type:complete
MTEQQVPIFISSDGQAQLEVALERNTAWLSQAQMGQLFNATPENVLMHLQNIFKDEGLIGQATTKESVVVRQEGQKTGSPSHQTLQPGCRHIRWLLGQFKARNPVPPMGH